MKEVEKGEIRINDFGWMVNLWFKLVFKFIRSFLYLCFIEVCFYLVVICIGNIL